jgi:cellulose synthase (UDP-forming)
LENIWHLFGDQATGSREQAMAALSSPLGERAAVLIGAEAPSGRSRSVVALLAGSPQGLDAMVDAMRDIKLVPNIQGDLALLAGGTMISYRAGGTYTAGYLPFWLWPEWWLQGKPSVLIVMMVAAAAVAAFSLYRVLCWRAVKRVARPRGT